MFLNLLKRNTGLCEYSNHTYVSVDSGFDNIISVKDEKMITGALGICIDKMLCRIDKRKCRIIGSPRTGLGLKHENGTYSGILGLLQSQKVDMYLKSEKDYLNESWLKKTLPLRTENMLIMQVIKSKEGNVRFFDMAENFRFEFNLILSYFATLFVGLLLCLAISRLTLKNDVRDFKRESIFSKLSILSKHLFSTNLLSLKMVLLFFTLYFWYTQLFLANNIKTNRVVVDTSDLIKNSIDLFKTKKIFCFLYNQSEMNLALTLPKDTVLSRLFYEKTYFRDDQAEEKLALGRDRCLLELDPKFVGFAKNNLILIISEAESYLFAMVYAETDFAKKIWLMNKGIQEYNVVIYYSLRNSYNEKWTQTVFALYFEHGLSGKMYDCLKSKSKMVYQKTLKVFESLEDYIKDGLNAFDHLDLVNFRTIFITFLSVLLFNLALFMIARLRKQSLFSKYALPLLKIFSDR